ncbi:GntR family transcriptional regulator [Shinella zoogloeoides]|uniref:GntR family transcriptional regulator n=1 Tax=Shinella zoogloeoides TaxID=352475 RepID=A0A6N8TH36_SHIZO|nr:GntR family transcriptional regulator [Shinella zoogloeoides]MXO00450.1 GntR family transcriptional regulator [Shinella zoogloeoides]UEX83955.1 GntR family transcriptional regulator [Shinella zoogloeoides]
MTDDADGLPLADRLARRMRALLISGELSPGQRLSEAAFSERFDVSRNSLREAFRLLTKDGLLHHEANRGVFVAVPSMASIIDIYRVRRMLECGALRQAWPQHPAIRIMRQSVSDGQRARDASDWTGVGSANMVFHAAVVDLSDSARLNEFYARISAELRLCFGLLNDPEHLHAPFVDMNATILSLVEENRPVEAAAQMETYLNLAERTMLKALERASDPA